MVQRFRKPQLIISNCYLVLLQIKILVAVLRPLISENQ